MLEPGILITITLSCIGAVVWAVRVEGRVNGHDKAFIDLDKLLNERDEGLNKLLEERDQRTSERHTELSARLSRIETKIDNGFRLGLGVKEGI